MLRTGDTFLLVVDVQDKLARVMHEKEALFESLRKIIKGAQALDIPILWAEQNPKGLGPTVPEVAELLADHEPISKLCFSCCGNTRFLQALRRIERRQVLVVGIEAHVCVYQTAMDLVDLGYEVQVVADAVSSRTEGNKQLGLERIRVAGGSLTSVEIALFELLKVAEGKRFKEILKVVK